MSGGGKGVHPVDILGGTSVDVPIGGTTGLDHESTARIDEAARWLAIQSPTPSPVIPALKARFGLTAPEACHAAREAALIRGRAE